MRIQSPAGGSLLYIAAVPRRQSSINWFNIPKPVRRYCISFRATFATSIERSGLAAGSVSGRLCLPVTGGEAFYAACRETEH